MTTVLDLMRITHAYAHMQEDQADIIRYFMRLGHFMRWDIPISRAAF